MRCKKIVPSLGLLLFPLIALAAGADNQAQVRKAEQLIKQGKYMEAFAAAREAVRLDGGDASGYYLAAMALYRQDLIEEAEKYAEGAVYRTSAEKRPAAENLLHEIGNKKQFHQQVAQGDQALKAGIYASAAASYSEAWRRVPAREEIGLRAARLWCEKTQDPKEGALIYRQLARSQDETIREEAKNRLMEIRPLLKKMGRDKQEEAKLLLAQGRADAALQAYSDAVALAPTSFAYADAADILVAQKKREQAMEFLRAGAREGGLRPEHVFAKNNLRGLCRSPEFIMLLGELFGPSTTAAAQEIARHASDLTGVWNVAKKDAKLSPPHLKIVQEGPRVMVEERAAATERESSVQRRFEGFREGNRLVGTLWLYPEAKRCRSRGIVEKMETVGEISDDGTTIFLEGGVIKTGFGIFGLGCNKGIEPRSEVWEKAELRFRQR